jgi:hypothetical protein
MTQESKIRVVQENLFGEERGQDCIEEARQEMMSDPERSSLDGALKRHKLAKQKIRTLAKILSLEPETCMAEAFERWVADIAAKVIRS